MGLQSNKNSAESPLIQTMMNYLRISTHCVYTLGQSWQINLWNAVFILLVIFIDCKPATFMDCEPVAYIDCEPVTFIESEPVALIDCECAFEIDCKCAYDIHWLQTCLWHSLTVNLHVTFIDFECACDIHWLWTCLEHLSTVNSEPVTFIDCESVAFIDCEHVFDIHSV